MIVFLSYIDDERVMRLAKDLQDSGVTITLQSTDVFDIGLAVLMPQSLALAGWDVVAQAGKPIIPVIIQSCPVPETLEEMPVSLAEDYASGYRELLKRLSAAQTGTSPYKGLLPYGEIDAGNFYGRGAFTGKLAQFIADGGNFIALFGPGGTGKTSLIRAGLIPLLRDSGDNWLPVQITVDDQPLLQIAHRLQPLTNLVDPLTSRLEADPSTLPSVLGEVTPAGSRLLLVFDSFESVFTRCSLTERVYFLDALYAAIHDNPRSAVIIIVVQTEFYERLAEYPRWGDLLQSQANRFDMPAMTLNEQADVIEQPARTAGLPVENSLVERITADLAQGRKTGILSRLSFILSALFVAGQFSQKRYQTLGGMNLALNRHVEELFEQFGNIEKLAVQRIALKFAEIVEDGTPIARAFPRDQLVFSWIESDRVHHVIEQLISSGVLTQNLDIDTREINLALSHEILLVEWTRLAGWIESDLDNLRYASRVEKMAANWVSRGYVDEGLLRGTELMEAMHWAENPDNLLPSLVQDYITASNELYKSYHEQVEIQTQTRNRATWVLGALAALLALVVIGAGIFSVETAQSRNKLATQQADTSNKLTTAVALNDSLAAARDAAATRQVELGNQAATAVANAGLAATAQSVAETAQAYASATLGVVLEQHDADSTEVANARIAQATAEAAIAMASTAQAQAQVDIVEARQQLQSYIAKLLARDAKIAALSNPALAIRLASESVAIVQSAGKDSTDGQAIESLRVALKSNASFNPASDAKNVWLLNASYMVVQYPDDSAKLWQANPVASTATLNGPVKQIIPVSNGALFLVNYSDNTPDEIWMTSTGTMVSRFGAKLAPALNIAANITIPNLVEVQNGAFFVVKLDKQPSELYESTGGKLITKLNGDFEKIVPLANGLFFSKYTNKEMKGDIWESATGKSLLQADDVFSEPYQNFIFIVRQKDKFDQIWRTDPLRQITEVVGRVISVTEMTGTPYIRIRFGAGLPAQLWREKDPVGIVANFSSDVTTSIIFPGNRYFITRHEGDPSPSEFWDTSLNPPDIAAILNGKVRNLDYNVVLDGQLAVIDYLNNNTSELWQVNPPKKLLSLNGNVAKMLPILGDTYFAVSYEGAQPAEIWSAIDPHLVSKMGDANQKVTDIIPFKGGTYLLVMYGNAPAEIWSVGKEGATLQTRLPDVVTRAWPLQPDDNFVVNFAKNPAQVWQVNPGRAVLTLNSSVNQLAFNGQTKRLSYSNTEKIPYILDFDTLLKLDAAGDKMLSDADLITLACSQIIPNADTEAVLKSYLAGAKPLACANGNNPEATAEATAQPGADTTDAGANPAGEGNADATVPNANNNTTPPDGDNALTAQPEAATNAGAAGSTDVTVPEANNNLAAPPAAPNANTESTAQPGVEVTAEATPEATPAPG